MRSSRRIWVGLDVGVESTSVCVIDDSGTVLQRAICQTRLDCIHREIRWLKRRRSARIGLEATSSFAIARGLQSLGYSVDLYETRQLSKFLRVRRNKTDAGDALGIAEAGRLGSTVLSKVFLKSFECQALQSRLTLRQQIVTQRVATINLLCRQIEQYGGRISGSRRSAKFRANVELEMRKVFGRNPTALTAALRQMLDRSEQLLRCQVALDRELTHLASENEVCKRFMEIPGVGPLCALAFYAAIGEPHRFARAADVGPYFGMTPKVHQSGLTSRMGRISRMGNKTVRSLLTRASSIFMRSTKPDLGLRSWALRIEERRGRGRVALARKLAVIMIAMWKNGQSFRTELAA